MVSIAQHVDFGRAHLCLAKKLVADSALHSYQMFTITASSKDMDHKLDGVLNTLALDTEGKLVRMLSLAGVFKLYEPIFEAFLTEWLENCTVNGRCESLSSLVEI